MENMLGVIGGMGPMASCLFYEMITRKTEASKDQDHTNIMILSHATMPDRTAVMFGSDSSDAEELLLEDCRSLEAAGCKAICVACNTAHYFLHRFEDRLGIPVISMIREGAAYMGRAHRGQKVAILATDGTVRSGLYQDAFRSEGVNPYTPGPDVQKIIMHVIYERVKAGLSPEPEAVSTITEDVRKAGCAAALIACTELSIMKSTEGLGTFYIDAMELMAERAIEFMGKKLKKQEVYQREYHT